jgi:hypothetical protein
MAACSNVSVSGGVAASLVRRLPKLQPFDAKAGTDRFATCDEVRVALSSMPDFFVECEKDSFWEVASNLDGNPLVENEEEGILRLLEEFEMTAN